MVIYLQKPGQPGNQNHSFTRDLLGKILFMLGSGFIPAKLRKCDSDDWNIAYFELKYVKVTHLPIACRFFEKA